MHKKLITGLSLLLITLVFILYICNYYFFSKPVTENKTIIIPKGSSFLNISQILYEKNIIKHPNLFSLIAILTLNHKNLQAGEYDFHFNLTVKDIIASMANGKVVIHNLTIPEGYTSKQIQDLINNNQLLSGDLVKLYPEGYLLPETFQYKYGEDRKKLIEKIHNKMIITLDNYWNNKQKNLPLSNKEELLVLASIIEKETSIPEEYKHIAGIFINRLNKKMRLQADPTVAYGITLGNYKLERLLNKRDLMTYSPYNTYVIPALPIKPICNPGRAALEAASHPMKTEDLYFVANGNGGHNFSSSLKKHNEYVRQWKTGSKK